MSHSILLLKHSLQCFFSNLAPRAINSTYYKLHYTNNRCQKYLVLPMKFVLIIKMLVSKTMYKMRSEINKVYNLKGKTELK